jgi:hypothetical protein
LDATNPSGAGQDCGAAGCHVAGGSGSAFEFMGTLCSDSACSTAGANLTVTFGSATATTDAAGNFYVAGTAIATAGNTATQGGFQMSGATYDCNGGGTCHMAKPAQTFPASGTGVGEGTVYN